MSVENKQVSSLLYHFDADYRVSYVNFSRSPDLTDSQLILTMERGIERQTFAFRQPHFNDVDRHILSADGLAVSRVKSNDFGPIRYEVADLYDGLVFFSAKEFKDITPSL